MMEILSINDTTYEVEMPSGDKIEIGDKEAIDFKPRLKLNRWGGECFVKVELPTTEKPAPIVEEDKVKFRSADIEAHFYALAPRTVTAKDKDGKDRPFTQNELGSFEFEIVLKQKPVTNQIVLDIQAQGLKFSYQPPLTQQEIDAGSIRPENVVGSYSVYHATRTRWHASLEDAEKYKAGKAFHIYRPKVTDANGSEVWANLNISDGKLTITVPQEFLDSAVYPVTIDPDLGYTTEGGTSYLIAEEFLTQYRRGSAWTMPAVVGATANYIRAYVNGSPGSGTVGCKVFINQKDSGGASNHGQIATKENVACAEAVHWEEFTLSGEALTGGITYILSIVGKEADLPEDDNYFLAGDANGCVASYFEGQDYAAPESPWLVSPEGTSIDYSIYCNYTGEAVGLENKSAGMGAKMIAGKLI